MLNLNLRSPVEKGDRDCTLTRPAVAGHAVYRPYQVLPAWGLTIVAAERHRFDNDEGRHSH